MKKKETSYVDKIMIGTSFLLRILILIEAVTAAWNKNLWLLFLTLCILILTFIPSFIERNYKINLPLELQFIVVVFISFSLFLGEMRSYYVKFWWWDVLLHSMSGIVLAFVGFLIVYILYTEKKIRMRPRFVLLFSFCFAVAIGSLWEIVEFTLDSFLGLQMQEASLFDTMLDLIVDSISALIVSVAGYFYVKRKKSSLFFRHLVERFVKANPKLFRRKKR
ncbi:hypothetical protein COV16_02870 [Candidatus Woesearchaeota archaeon CG10_big_fil_rev_8_21_14_0_10_34_8]|nr:MAG: hypothetical protein COV16_02870 [Candidatus Woesearchaeota archaeon CG10_big_fil_rev_8_21_14_0_10_34_8]